jgi:cytochrome P450
MTGSNDAHKSVSHPTIFHAVLESSLPPEEKKLSRLWQEGQTVIGAGTETTAWALSVITFHILSNPAIRQKLLSELGPLFQSTDGNPTFQLTRAVAISRWRDFRGIEAESRRHHTLAARIPRCRLTFPKLGNPTRNTSFYEQHTDPPKPHHLPIPSHLQS